MSPVESAVLEARPCVCDLLPAPRTPSPQLCGAPVLGCPKPDEGETNVDHPKKQAGCGWREGREVRPSHSENSGCSPAVNRP